MDVSYYDNGKICFHIYEILSFIKNVKLIELMYTKKVIFIKSDTETVGNFIFKMHYF